MSLLASAGGAVLDEQADAPVLSGAPTREVLRILHRLAQSPSVDPGSATAREDQSRLAFESGGSSFIVNYTYVWSSARANAPAVAEHMG